MIKLLKKLWNDSKIEWEVEFFCDFYFDLNLVEISEKQEEHFRNFLNGKVEEPTIPGDEIYNQTIGHYFLQIEEEI